MKKLLAGWGKAVVKFRWLIIGVWVVLLIVGGIFAAQLGSLLTGGGWGVPHSSSNHAYELISENFETRKSTSLSFVMHHEKHEIDSIEYGNALKKASNFLSEEKEIDRVYTWLDASTQLKESFVSHDGKTTIGFVEMNIDEGFAQKVLGDIQTRLTTYMKSEQFEVVILGAPAFWAEVNELSQQGLNHAHLFALPIILLILLLVFRSLVSALTPLVLSVFSIVVALGLLYFIANQTELSVFLLDAALMLGIGVGIDFSLIFVMRFKEELKKAQGNISHSIEMTMQTAGHAILFSSLTILGAMAAILSVDISAVRSIALGILVVVFLLLLTSLSLLPAILAVMGNRTNALSISFLTKLTKGKKNGGWARFAGTIMTRPILYLAGSVLLLLLIAWPAMQLKVSTADVRMLPGHTKVSQGIELLETGFGIGYASPIHVVIQSNGEKMTSERNLAQLDQLQSKLQSIENVVDVSSILSYFPDTEIEVVSSLLTINRDQLPKESLFMMNRNLSKNNDIAIIDIITNDYSSSENNRQLVESIKNVASEFKGENNPFSIYIGGETAEGIDTSDSLNKSLPKVAIYTLILIFIVLVFTFKSIALPLKAIAMNILSLGATYGILVITFQWGWGANIFGFGDFGPIQSFIPILLLGLLFSLSTDYEVFLLSRVQEEFSYGYSNEESVSLGLKKTAPMISGAALIMVTVFSSFAFAGVLPMQQLGLGMAVAIALDATIIRLVIVPASMKLLGNWNWWFPFGGKKGKNS